ncbi:uncharacterized protein [Argopecten irradians]|uniref:uncharacterized protein n=1 Tax=Argopecten irradians TaxID=31199 RepID=UPI003713FB16
MSAYVFKITTLFKLVLPVLHVLINLKVQCTDSSPTQTGGIINVTGYAATGDKLKEYIIVMSNATWFGALSTCDTIGTFTTSGPNGFPFTYIRNQIFLYFPELIGQPLWTAFHKPNLDGVWYKQKKCNRPLDRKSYKTFANDDPTKRQCLLLNTSSNPDDMDFSWYGASCHDRHSFICSKTFGKF